MLKILCQYIVVNILLHYVFHAKIIYLGSNLMRIFIVASSFFTFYASIMEQHPVPRNITGFQFHLIGDMTLRQFGYLATGVAVGYLLYKTAPFSAIVNIPLALSCGFVGFAFAFLPIQERPLEKWLAAFIKSIMSPTQYIWYKKNPPPAILAKAIALHAVVVQPAHQIQAHRETNEKLKAYLSSIPVPIHETLNAAEKRYIDKTLALFQTSSLVTPQGDLGLSPPTKPAPSLEPIPKIEEPPESKKSSVVAEAKEDQTVLRNQLSQLAAEKQALEQQLQKLQQQLSGITTPHIIKPAVSAEKMEPTIKVVTPKSAADTVGMLNYQQAPNLIAGAIKDPQRKLLPNIILTIKDKTGLPVRALKTNKLGQFSAATPLPSGVYLLEVEDPLKRYVFDVAEITLSGKVFLPIEIIAKGEKELLREKLTKELFGDQLV